MFPDVLYELFSDMPRQGPGSNKYTRKAYHLIQSLPPQPHILDVGCGAGMQTLELARISNGKVTAVDNYRPFLDELRKHAKSKGLDEKIETVNGSMFELPLAKNSFDIIWSEGAIYTIGFEKGLCEWKPLIKCGAYLVASELTWVRPNMPNEVCTYLEGEYSAIKDIEGNREIIRQADYNEVGSFVLPKSGWWDDFYRPLQRHLNLLKPKYIGNHEATTALDTIQLEIDMYEKYSRYYSYVFYLMQPK
jgi:ubiquinone/menaquinone biosynthesis C-methylase UbiE